MLSKIAQFKIWLLAVKHHMCTRPRRIYPTDEGGLFFYPTDEGGLFFHPTDEGGLFFNLQQQLIATLAIATACIQFKGVSFSTVVL